MIRTPIFSLLLLALAVSDVHAWSRTNADCLCIDKCGATAARQTEWCHIMPSQCPSPAGVDWDYCASSPVKYISTCAGTPRTLSATWDLQEVTLCCVDNDLYSSDSPLVSSSGWWYCPNSQLAVNSWKCRGEANVQMDEMNSIWILRGTTKEFSGSDFIEDSGSYTGSLRDCGTDKRVQILSVKIVGIRGVLMRAKVQYVDPATGIDWLPNGEVSEQCAIEMTSSDADWSLALEKAHPEVTDAKVVVWCPPYSECSINYEIKATCVNKRTVTPTTSSPTTSSPTTSSPTTSFSASSATKSTMVVDYFAASLTFVTSLAAVIIAMRLRN